MGVCDTTYSRRPIRTSKSRSQSLDRTQRLTIFILDTLILSSHLDSCVHINQIRQYFRAVPYRCRSFSLSPRVPPAIAAPAIGSHADDLQVVSPRQSTHDRWNTCPDSALASSRDVAIATLRKDEPAIGAVRAANPDVSQARLLPRGCQGPGAGGAPSAVRLPAVGQNKRFGFSAPTHCH